MAFLCLLVPSCGSKEESHRSNPAFWSTSEVDLPEFIPKFCARVRTIFATKNLDGKFRCRDNLGNNYAAAGNDSEKEVVLLVGAGNSWYLFSVFHKNSRTATSADINEMINLKSDIEHEFRGH